MNRRFFFVLAATALLVSGLLINASHAEEKMKDMEMEEGSDMGKKEMKMDMETPQSGIFSGKGKVVSIMHPIKKIIISHEEIEGFMKAMPMGMGYAVADESLLAKVNPGDNVHFKIDASIKKIVEIEKESKNSMD